MVNTDPNFRVKMKNQGDTSMARICKFVTVFVSRSMYHGGDGLEIGGLVIFRSMEEFKTMEQQRGWDKMEGVKGDSWCSDPEEFKAALTATNAKRWADGKAVDNKYFMFAATDIDKLYRLGGWR